MKRRLFGLLALAMVMVMTLGMTVMAAESPGEEHFEIQEGNAEQVAAARAEFDALNKIFNGKLYAEVSLTVVDVTYWVNGVLTPYEDSLTITFSGFKTNTPYLVMHQMHNGQWEDYFKTSTGNGEITVTFNGLSTVAFAELVEDTGDGTNPQPAASTTQPGNLAVSPKTGEAVPVAAWTGLVCLAGAGYCAVQLGRKKRA